MRVENMTVEQHGSVKDFRSMKIWCYKSVLVEAHLLDF